MVKKRKQKVSKKFIPQASLVSDELYLPNHSGEHTAGTTGTPINDRDIANKKYVDDKNVESFPTTFTAGSVPFSDGSNLAQDNFNLFWDDAKNQLEPNLIKITSDGTQASPALKFNDTNTGFYKSGDSVRLSLNNSTKMTIDSTGVGIGIASPAVKFHVGTAGTWTSLLTGLVSYWKLDESSGNAIDSHGDNDATVIGASYSATGIINTAFDFEASTTDYLNPNITFNAGTTDFSFSCWFKPEDVTAITSTLFSTDESSAGNRGFQLMQLNDTLQIYDGTAQDVTTGSVLTAGTWYHIVYTHDGTNKKIYVDAGTPASAASNFKNVTKALIICQRSTTNPANFVDGIVDEIGFWSRALTPSEITELYNSGAGSAYSPTKNTFAVDETNNKVGIGTASPSEKLTLNNGTLLFQNDGGLPFTEIYASDNSTATTISTQNVWVQCTIFDTDGQSNNCTPDHTNDHITITKAGMYMVNVSASVFSGAGAAFDGEFEVKKNNGTADLLNIHTDRDLAGGGSDHGSISMSGIADLSVNDTIEVWCRNKTNTVDITFEDVTLSLVMIGGT